MGNCAASPCGEPNNFIESNNKKISFKSFFQHENDKTASKTYLIKRKDSPIQLNQERVKIDTLMSESNKTKFSNGMLDTSISYEKNHTDALKHRKINSYQISKNTTDADHYFGNDSIYKAFNLNKSSKNYN